MSDHKDDFTATDIAEWLGTQPEPVPANPQDGLGHLADRAVAAFHAARERARLRREFEMLDREGELDRVLADAHMTRDEIEPILANYPASADRLERMAARLGVTKAMHRDAQAERAMQHECSVCLQQGKCRHWLESGAAEGYAEFCPNAELLTEMRHARK